MNLMRNGKSRFFRTLYAVCAVLAVLLIAAGIIGGTKYYRLTQNPVSAEILSGPAFDTEKEVTLGQIVPCRITLKAPWGSAPEKPEITDGSGLQLTAEPDVCEGHFAWGWREWNIIMNFQPYRTGTPGDGRIQFAMRGPSGNLTMFDLPIKAGFTIVDAPVDLSGELDTAQKIKPEKKRFSLFVIISILAGLIAVAAVLVWLILRKRKKTEEEKKKTVWEVAMDAIDELKKKVMGNQTTPEQALGTLTDIVRTFIEKRYFLRAERQTTSEFLYEMDRSSSPLKEQDRIFLRHFLESADMVKFAKMKADRHLFENAAFQAEKLVAGSREQENAGGVK